MSRELTQEERSWFEAQRAKTIASVSRVIEGGLVRFMAVSLLPLLAFLVAAVALVVAEGGLDDDNAGLFVYLAVATIGLFSFANNEWQQMPKRLDWLTRADVDHLARWRLRLLSRGRVDPDENLLTFVWIGCTVAAFCSVMVRNELLGAFGMTLAIAGGVVGAWMGVRRLASRPPATVRPRPSLLAELFIPLVLSLVSSGAVRMIAEMR